MPLREAEENIALPGSMSAPAWVEILELLWARRRRVAMWVVVGMLLAALLAWRGGRYEATVQLMPPDASAPGMSGILPLLSRSTGVSPGLLGLAGDAMGLKSTTALFSKIVQSRTVQDNLVNQFDLRTVYKRKYNVDARKQLGDNTAIEEDKRSGVLSVTVRDKDPARARDLANAYAVQLNLVLTNASTSSARREREFIEQRLQEEQKAMQESEEKLSKFSSGTMALDVPEQIRVTVESAARLQGELIAARSELQGLEQIYTPENVRVKSARARVGELEQSLNKINGGRPGGAPDPSYPYPSVKALPGLSVEWSNLYRDAKIHETVYEMLTTQLESARIQEAKEVPSAKVLDPAVLPEKKYPRPFWVMIIGTLVSAFLSCTGVVLKARWENWDEADPRRVLLSGIHFGIRNRLNRVLGLFRRQKATADHT